MSSLWKKRIKAIYIAAGLIAFWRGVWGLLDMYLFPDNLTASYSISVIVGILILVSTHHAIGELMHEE